MNRAVCILQLVSCVFTALSDAFHPSWRGNEPEKAHEQSRKEEHSYILEEFLLSHGKPFGFSSGPQWKFGILPCPRAQQNSSAVSRTRWGGCAEGEGAGECVSVCV